MTSKQIRSLRPGCKIFYDSPYSSNKYEGVVIKVLSKDHIEIDWTCLNDLNHVGIVAYAEDILAQSCFTLIELISQIGISEII